MTTPVAVDPGADCLTNAHHRSTREWGRAGEVWTTGTWYYRRLRRHQGGLATHTVPAPGFHSVFNRAKSTSSPQPSVFQWF